MAKESYISKINNTKIFAERAEYTKGGKNIDNMVEKVASATSGNLAAFDANGGLVDSNQAAANLVHDASYVHTDSNFTVAEKNKLNGIESGAQVNVIETVKVNGTTQTVTSKAIDISVPTAGTSNPSMDGTASAGSATTWSKSDHVHPTDTSREATANKDSSIPSSPVSGHYPSTEAVLQFVNSSISTNTANFLGTYDVVTDLGLTTSATNAQIASALNSYTFPAGTTVTNNDYVFVSINYSTTTDVDEYRRFKYSDASNGSWAYEYTLNNSSFTQAQWDAINSAITSTKVGNYDTHIANTNNPHGVTKAQVGLGNVGNFLAVSTDANQGLTDTQKVNARANIGAGTYVKPNDGIPKTDLASGVQTSLGKADTAYQKPNGGIPDSDIASASTWNAKQDALPTTGSASTTYAINVSGKAATAGTADSANSVAWSNVSGKPTVDQNFDTPSSANAVSVAAVYNRYYKANIGVGTNVLRLCRIKPSNISSYRQIMKIRVFWSYISSPNSPIISAEFRIQFVNSLTPGRIVYDVFDVSYNSDAFKFGYGVDSDTGHVDFLMSYGSSFVSSLTGRAVVEVEVSDDNAGIDFTAPHVGNSMPSYTYSIDILKKTIVSTSSTAGLLKNDGSVDTNSYALTSAIPTVDQNYNSTSTNPQSGTAVAQAVATKEDLFIRNSGPSPYIIFGKNIASGIYDGQRFEIVSSWGNNTYKLVGRLRFPPSSADNPLAGCTLSICSYPNTPSYEFYYKLDGTWLSIVIKLNNFGKSVVTVKPSDMPMEVESTFDTTGYTRLDSFPEVINMRDASWINSGTFQAAQIPTSLPNVTAGYAQNLTPGGTSGQYLKSNGANNAPSWDDPTNLTVGAASTAENETAWSPAYIRGKLFDLTWEGTRTDIVVSARVSFVYGSSYPNESETFDILVRFTGTTASITRTDMRVRSSFRCGSTCEFGCRLNNGKLEVWCSHVQTATANYITGSRVVLEFVSHNDFVTVGRTFVPSQTWPTMLKEVKDYEVVAYVKNGNLPAGSTSTPVYVDAGGQLQPCDPSQMTVGAASTVALRMDSPTYIDISWANVSWSDFCGAGANSLLQKVFSSNYDSVWRTITVIGRIEACPVDFEANTGISASAMNYGNFIGVKSRDAMFVKFFTNAKHNNGQYPIYEITFGLSASSGISGIRSIMKNVVISSATQSLPGGSGSATKPVYTDQRGELKPCSSELPNGYGTSGQYLKSNGANNAPSWANPSDMTVGTADVAKRFTSFYKENSGSSNKVYRVGGITTSDTDLSGSGVFLLFECRDNSQSKTGKGIILLKRGEYSSDAVSAEFVWLQRHSTVYSGDIDIYYVPISGSNSKVDLYVKCSGYGRFRVSLFGSLSLSAWTFESESTGGLNSLPSGAVAISMANHYVSTTWGTSGQYLKSMGANAAPVWDDTSNINAGSVNGYSIDVRIGGTPGSDPNTIYFC